MNNFMEKINSIREAAEKEVLELIEIISDDERLHNEFPAMKKIFIDTFRQLEIETLKLQPTNQKEFWAKNYLAAILQDLQTAIKGLFVCVFTTSNFHEFPQEKARFFKATIRGSLKRFDYLFNEMKKVVYSPALVEDDSNDLIGEDTEETVEEEIGFGFNHVDIGDADCLFIDDMDKYEGVDAYASQNTEGF